MAKKKTKKEKAIDTLLTCVIIDAILLIIFTVICFIAFIKTGVEPVALITGFYTTFGFEIVACAAIKIFNIKFPKKGENENDYICGDSP